VAVSFDLFDTLVTADRPAEPWEAVATQLRARGVAVPDDWEELYRRSHVSVERGRELSLVRHTRAALASRDIEADTETVAAALLDAFDGPVTVRDGADAALAAAASRGPVGVLSNCSLPGLVDRTLQRAALPIEFDATVTSVECGWRKPHDPAFEAAADALGVAVADLVHVGDDPRADGGARTTGATAVLTEDIPLAEFPAWVEAECP
jgi:FMN phosphatase YigB (HAD superfamily)